MKHGKHDDLLGLRTKKGPNTGSDALERIESRDA
jgi:hypothetical protein